MKYYKAIGNTDLLKTDIIVIAGTRSPSLTGLNYTAQFCQLMSFKTIASGFARGIDSEVHRLCLLKKIPQIAFIPNQEIYPNINKDIYKQIIDSNGLVIHCYNEPLTKETFLKRNDMMAYYARGAIIVETEERTGTLRLANSLNKLGKKIVYVDELVECDQIKKLKYSLNWESIWR